MTPKKSKQDQTTIRLSFSWLVLAALLIAALGLIGGLIGQQIWQPSLIDLVDNQDALVTTVQEVTISPNTAAAELIDQAHRSVLLLGPANNPNRSTASTALVITNDGLVVTTAALPTAPQTAYDDTGRPIPLQPLGRDDLFGLTYFRITDNVVTPLDISSTDSQTGTTLLALSRNPNTFSPRVSPYLIQQYILPASNTSAGIQRLMQSQTQADPLLNGAPLIDEEGKVAGLIINTQTGQALPVNELKQSLERVTANNRELNPFLELGFSLNYKFTATPGSSVKFIAEVAAISPNKPAAAAKLTRGDIVTAINDTPVEWSTNISQLLSEALPITLALERQGQPQTVTLTPVP